MSEWPSVISIGEALWDVFCHPNGNRNCRLGGAPANFACHVARHGISACTVSAIGQDAAGDELAAALAAAGVPCVLQRVDYPTGVVEVVLREAGEPCYSILPDAAWDHIATSADLLAMASRARAVCFGSLAQRSAESRASIAAILRVVPLDCLRIFDVNLRCGFYTREIIRDSLSMADVLKLNEEEVEVLGRMEGFCGQPQLEQARRLVLRYGLSMLILTCGHIGSYVLDETGQVLSYVPTPRVHVEDTVGAGDSFTATFIAGLLRGFSVPLAQVTSVKLAAFVCSQPGAMPALPENLLLREASCKTSGICIPCAKN